MSSGLTELRLQGAMRGHKIVDRIFQIDVALQVRFLIADETGSCAPDVSCCGETLSCRALRMRC